MMHTAMSKAKMSVSHSKPMKPYILEKTESGCLICSSHKTRSRLRGNIYGYPQITVGKKPIKLVKYMWEQRYGKINDGLVMRHLCDNVECVNLEHIGTYKENTQDAVIKGRIAWGERQGSSKLSENDVITIFNSKEKNNVLALEYGVSNTTIAEIKRGESWSRLTIGIVNTLRHAK